MTTISNLEVVLQIHHLDDGEETDFVLTHLGSAAELTDCRIERPTDETNSILIHCETGAGQDEAELIAMLRKASRLIGQISIEQVSAVTATGMGVLLCVRSNLWRVHLPTELLSDCGKKSIPISVINTALETFESSP